MGRKKLNALILLDAQDYQVLGKVQQVECEWMNAVLKIIDYRQLNSLIPELQRIVAENRIDLVLYSRNDQVFERINIGHITAELRVGYSSFSGIDTGHANEQMATCWADLMHGGTRLELPGTLTTPLSDGDERDGTFSLVFDLEQLGGARYALPRILELLAEKRVRATFFITDFIRQLYPEVPETIVTGGHEIGIHGQYHEYLSGLDYDEQCRRVVASCDDFRTVYPVVGANLIYRMDHLTVRALAHTGITYFVDFFEHNYHVPSLSYLRLPVRPLPILFGGLDGKSLTEQRWIWLVPVPVETYGRPWYTIRNMVNSALTVGRSQGYAHVQVLLHPFRDGALWHLGTLSKLIDYLMINKNLRPMLTHDLIDKQQTYNPDCWILYRPGAINSGAQPIVNRHVYRNWDNLDMYHLRLGTLFEFLRRAGKHPALILDEEEKGMGTGYSIFPGLSDASSETLYSFADPLLMRDGMDWVTEEQGWQAFVPPSGKSRNYLAEFRTLGPANSWDLTALPLEVAVRMLQRLKPNRNLF